MKKAKPLLGCLTIIALIVILAVASGAFYTVKETEQVIITKFGKPVGEPITEAGLKFKIPFIHEVNRIEKFVLSWDGLATEMPTKDKTYISVDTYARWQIVEPLEYFERLRNKRRALSRLDDILGSETRNVVAKHELIEVVRSTKERKPVVSEELAASKMAGNMGKLLPIRRGRTALEKEIFETSESKLSEYGIKLLDVRFKRINYNKDVRKQIYERMISERQQIADLFRSEGAGEAAKILGNMQRDLKEIQSTAYKEVQVIRGKADAKATEVYAQAYNVSPEAAEFYQFLRTMELYESMLAGDSTVVLSTDSDLFQYLKGASPNSVPKPVQIAPKPRQLAKPNVER
ncbi:MAG: protease modulator HflC [Verrucomicrobiota bacterium]